MINAGKPALFPVPHENVSNYPSRRRPRKAGRYTETRVWGLAERPANRSGVSSCFIRDLGVKWQHSTARTRGPARTRSFDEEVQVRLLMIALKTGIEKRSQSRRGHAKKLVRLQRPVLKIAIRWQNGQSLAGRPPRRKHSDKTRGKVTNSEPVLPLKARFGGLQTPDHKICT